MHVTVTEHWPDGRTTLRPGVALDVAVPEAPLRATARAMLAQRATARVPAIGDRPQLTLHLTRHAAGFGIRLRIKSGGLKPDAFVSANDFLRAEALSEDVGRFQRSASRIAEVMLDRAGAEGCCTLKDLRLAGISRTQAYRYADAAREIIAAA